MNYELLKQSYKEAVDILNCLEDTILNENALKEDFIKTDVYRSVKKWVVTFLTNQEKVQIGYKSIFSGQVTISIERKK